MSCIACMDWFRPLAWSKYHTPLTCIFAFLWMEEDSEYRFEVVGSKTVFFYCAPLPANNWLCMCCHERPYLNGVHSLSDCELDGYYRWWRGGGGLKRIVLSFCCFLTIRTTVLRVHTSSDRALITTPPPHPHPTHTPPPLCAVLV